MDNHPKKECIFWIQGKCKKGEECNLKHTIKRVENYSQKEQSSSKESNMDEQTAEYEYEYESRLEYIVNAVKEGFRTQNDLLSSTLKGAHQEQQNTTPKQGQQTNTHLAQPIPMRHAQNLPKLMMQGNPFQTNRYSLFNI